LGLVYRGTARTGKAGARRRHRETFLVHAPWNSVRSSTPASSKNFAAGIAEIPVYKSGTTCSRIMMPTRRTLLVRALIALFAAGDHYMARAEPPPANDPVAIVTAIYTRAARGKGDGGGGFVIESKAAKARYLSKPLIALWAEADTMTPKDDVGPIDFDPVTNSQEPDVKSFSLATEKLETGKAVIAVTIVGHRTDRGNPADQIVRYDFVKEADRWKIDDILNAVDGKPWSIRELLMQHMKNLQKKS
jgi:Protein of unknown function (DUF3828)